MAEIAGVDWIFLVKGYGGVDMRGDGLIRIISLSLFISLSSLSPTSFYFLLLSSVFRCLNDLDDCVYERGNESKIRHKFFKMKISF